jgi:hypothetical protein
MLTIIGSIATVFALAGSFVLVAVGIVALGHLFVQDFIDRHERRFHRDDGKRSTTSSTDGK